MKKLMLALMAAQAMTLAVPVAAHADIVNLHPIAAPAVSATATPNATVNVFSER